MGQCADSAEGILVKGFCLHRVWSVFNRWYLLIYHDLDLTWVRFLISTISVTLADTILTSMSWGTTGQLHTSDRHLKGMDCSTSQQPWNAKTWWYSFSDSERRRYQRDTLPWHFLQPPDIFNIVPSVTHWRSSDVVCGCPGAKWKNIRVADSILCRPVNIEGTY